MGGSRGHSYELASLYASLRPRSHNAIRYKSHLIFSIFALNANSGWDAVFQQLDLDYTLGEPHAMADWKEGPVPIIHMYGLTREGHSVLVHLHGVLPYFYVPAPHAQFSEDDCESFRLALNVPASSPAALSVSSRSLTECAYGFCQTETVCESRAWSQGTQGLRHRRHRGAEGVHHGLPCRQTEALLAYHDGHASSCARCSRSDFFFLLTPHLQSCAVLTFPLSLLPAGILEAGLVFDGYPNGRTFQTYESNIAFVLRFMIDKKMTGSAWLELAANKYEVVPDDQKVSHCQFELHAKYEPFPHVAVQ